MLLDSKLVYPIAYQTSLLKYLQLLGRLMDSNLIFLISLNPLSKLLLLL